MAPISAYMVLKRLVPCYATKCKFLVPISRDTVGTSMTHYGSLWEHLWLSMGTSPGEHGLCTQDNFSLLSGCGLWAIVIWAELFDTVLLLCFAASCLLVGFKLASAIIYVVMMMCEAPSGPPTWREELHQMMLERERFPKVAVTSARTRYLNRV